MPMRLRRAALEGARVGVAAGAPMAIVAAGAAAASAGGVVGLARAVAGVAIGAPAVDVIPRSVAITAGLGVHLLLSATFGTLYALLNARRPGPTRRSYLWQGVGGLLYGALVGAAGLHLVAPLIAPWLAPASPIDVIALHACAFGLPLGLLYAATERRLRSLSRAAADVIAV